MLIVVSASNHCRVDKFHQRDEQLAERVLGGRVFFGAMNQRIGRDARAKPDVGIHAWIALFTGQMLDYICSQQCYGAADIPYFNARNASIRYVGDTGTNTAE